ncbi:MAG TPA: phosphotransferase family protein [Mycobacterium sp.]
MNYLLQRSGHNVVLRRGPRPPYPASAHNMVREARLLQALHTEGVPVPRVIAICEDDAVLGVPFYLMEFLDGIVLTDELPSWVHDPISRRAVVQSAMDELASLHALDVSAAPLAQFGKTSGYLERQVALFHTLWGRITRRELPEFAEVGGWLERHLPVSQRLSVVHGDYRLGNLMYDRAAPARATGILDWEMATLGDPLADLGYFTATYSADDRPPTVMDLTSVTRETGFPTRAEIVEYYARRSTLDVSHLAWYEALAYWKSAVFCEEIYTRWLDGERPGDLFAPRLRAGVPGLLAAARGVIDRSR